MTSQAFLARYPEFQRAGLTLIDATLAETAGRLDQEVFGTRYDEAHGALTAHALWSSAFGVSLRLDGEGSAESKYKQHFDRIVKELTTARSMLVL